MPAVDTASVPSPPLVVRKVRGMGRGVFAGRAFRRGEVIEACPVLVLPNGTKEAELGGSLEHYVFKWGPDETGLALALGYGSLYNHSADPNAAFTPRHARADIVFRALRDIAAGEQILIDYRWESEDYEHFR